MDLFELVNQYINNGYRSDDAISKVAQDIILLKISKSKFSSHVTIKGGVVMHSISENIRRATRDLDMDFIKYSLEDESIIRFVKDLNNAKDKIIISIKGKIDNLHHQDYDGKRVYVTLTDINNYTIESKLDIGVHKFFEIEQDDYCFDLSLLNKNINLLINSKEQIFVEKLKSLLRFGITSTRYKDIFDFYYLINNENLNKDKLANYIKILICKDVTMKEKTIKDIINRLTVILNNKTYKRRLNSANNNWLELPINHVIQNVLNYVCNLEKLSV